MQWRQKLYWHQSWSYVCEARFLSSFVNICYTSSVSLNVRLYSTMLKITRMLPKNFKQLKKILNMLTIQPLWSKDCPIKNYCTISMPLNLKNWTLLRGDKLHTWNILQNQTVTSAVELEIHTSPRLTELEFISRISVLTHWSNLASKVIFSTVHR